MNLAPIAVACAVAVAGCSPPPEPRALRAVEEARAHPSAELARVHAPQLHARAEQLAAAAESARARGDAASARLLGEHAVAAFHRAFAGARLVRAEQRRRRAVERLTKQDALLAELAAEQAALEKDIERLELRAKVLRDALPRARTEPSSPEREAARLAAARALSVEARLLCVAAKLLAVEAAGEAERRLTALDALDRTLAGAPQATPIDAALDLRAACLTLLTAQRRADPVADVTTADALLAELTALGTLEAARDERGVVVTLRDWDAKGALTAQGRDRIEALGRVARAHPGFPVLVVLHTARAAAPHDPGRLAVVAEILSRAGAARLATQVAGNGRPLRAPGTAEAARRNERLEVVFVTRR